MKCWIKLSMLPCKAKRQYLLALQVSRYCLLALQSSMRHLLDNIRCSHTAVIRDDNYYGRRKLGGRCSEGGPAPPSDKRRWIFRLFQAPRCSACPVPVFIRPICGFGFLLARPRASNPRSTMDLLICVAHLIIKLHEHVLFWWTKFLTTEEGRITKPI